MKAKIFTEEVHGVGAQFVRDMERLGKKLKKGPCLCEHDTLDDDLQLALVHPHPEEYADKCIPKINSLIKRYPNIDFYIFAIGKVELVEYRIKGIGHHPNVKYITNDNYEVYGEIIDKLSDL